MFLVSVVSNRLKYLKLVLAILMGILWVFSAYFYGFVNIIFILNFDNFIDIYMHFYFVIFKGLEFIFMVYVKIILSLNFYHVSTYLY